MVSKEKKLDPPTFVPAPETPRPLAVPKKTEKDETYGDDREQNRNSGAWQFAIVFVVGIIMLFATDSLDLKLIQNSGQPSGETEPSHVGEHVVNKHHEFLPGAVHVETKEHLKIPDTATKEGQEVGTENKASESTTEQNKSPGLVKPTDGKEQSTQTESSETVSGQEEAPSKSGNEQTKDSGTNGGEADKDTTSTEVNEAAKETSVEPAETAAEGSTATDEGKLEDTKPNAAETPGGDTPAATEAAAANSETDSQPATTDSAVAAASSETDSQPDSAAAATNSQTDSQPATNAVGGRRDVAAGRRLYRRRGQPLSEADRKAMEDKWGKWTLEDAKERPTTDYYKKYKYRDIPRKDFPSNAWQIDKEYLSKFLPEGLALVERAQEAILAEYGRTQDTYEEREKLFHVELLDNLDDKGKMEEAVEGGGYMPRRSFDSLVRRILHAMMTEDNFIFAMGGHSAAAGHGNHFQQSYTLQVQWILEAVFARLHVRHEARNFGNGGLGTLHNSVAAGSLYGPDVDVLHWDSGMTEKQGEPRDLFIRQALMSGIKVPFIYQGSYWQDYYKWAGVDGGTPGNANLPVCSNVAECEKMAWAVQYVTCTNEMKNICRSKEYVGQCWVDRDDFTPTQTQNKEPGGRAGWHPGNRIHQRKGRVFAFGILTALKAALTIWNEAPNYELPDEAWHIGDYYDKIRSKIPEVRGNQGKCFNYPEQFRKICTMPLKGRTEFTPRAYPALTNIRNLMRPEQVDYIGKKPPPVYNPPDVFNPSLHPPPGAVDVLSIVEAGVDFKPILDPDYTDFYKKPAFKEKNPKVPIGKGWYLHTMTGDWMCDGSVDSFCGKSSWNQCLLYGHNDYRGGMLMDSVAGWGVMNIPDVKNGFIMVKIETWHQPKENQKTAEWKTINNERRLLRGLGEEEASNNYSKTNSSSVAELMSHVPDIFAGNYTAEQQKRRNLGKAPPYCKDFRFEFAIDGKITVENEEQFMKRYWKAERVVEFVLLLDDPKYTGGKETEIEIAIRQTGCLHNGRIFSLSHVYWS